MKNNRIALLFTCVVLGGASFTAKAQETNIPALCTSCHGKQLQGNSALKAPAIAGKEKWYLLKQLKDFQSGVRGSHAEDFAGQQMRASIAAYPQEKLSDLADMIHRVQAVVGEYRQAKAGSAAQGAKIYNSRCGACHGGKAQGNEAFKAPALTNMSFWYLKAQLINFKKGIRGTHQNDKLGRQMSMMAKTLANDAEMNDVIAFLMSLNEKQK